MAIYLGGETAAKKANLDDLTPRQIVEELDRYVVGQNAAKKAVAVALPDDGARVVAEPMSGSPKADRET